MIEPKLKPCKGTGKAKGSGCENKVYPILYGLCLRCRADWAMNTDNGKVWFKKQTAYKLVKDNAIYKKEYNTRKKSNQIKLLTSDGYRAKYLQPKINEIARLIDYGQPCIATEIYDGKENGGHYYSVGQNRTICLNLHNIFLQSFESNHHKSGDGIRYRVGLIKTFGNDYFEFIESLNKTPVIKKNKTDFIEYASRCTGIIKRLKNNLYKRNPKERIELRNQINDEIGIYPEEYIKYEIKQYKPKN